MRQIIFDTETTGMNKGAPYTGEQTVASGHRIIEIGCIELLDRRLSGRHFHCYLRPEREVDPEAVKVHGITDAFLADKPTFAEIANDLWHYLEGADELIAHNMRFDQAFLDEEIRLLGQTPPLAKRFTLVDTLQLAKARHPGQKNSLDALCKRYNVDNSNRNLHGALLDAELLAEVYLRLTGGQSSLILDSQPQVITAMPTATTANTATTQTWLEIKVSTQEQAEHQRIMDSIKPKSS